MLQFKYVSLTLSIIAPARSFAPFPQKVNIISGEIRDLN